MPSRTVVIVENEHEQRNRLQKMLEKREFRALGAATVAESRHLLQTLGAEIDVMVLDMKLDDPDDPKVTGADIAIQYRDQHPGWMPECLITTVHGNRVDYYRLALRLGAVAYLLKDEVRDEDIVRHVSALMLKRSLRLERPQVMQALNAISTSTKNLSQAVIKFCREVLAGELKACVAAPYMLLLTDERGTQNVATNIGLPTGYESFYVAIQDMAHGITNFSRSYVISEQDMKGLPTTVSAVAAKVLARLAGAAILPLADIMNFRLSLALFAPLADEKQYQEDPGRLADVLAQYVRPTIVEHFLSILIQLDSQKKAMLKSISDLCIYLGQAQQKILDEGIAGHDLQEKSNAYQRLVTMAGDLWQTGTILHSAVNNPLNNDSLRLEMGELIKSAFADLRNMITQEELDFKIEGSCRVKARRDDMHIAVKRLLQWLAERRTETPPHLPPQIHVQCVERNDSAFIIFEDRSRRLPMNLRAHLFDPFATSVVIQGEKTERGPGLYLPLYLAKILVEEKYGGWLDDKSDEMKAETGHRLVMRFSLTDERAA